MTSSTFFSYFLESIRPPHVMFLHKMGQLMPRLGSRDVWMKWRMTCLLFNSLSYAFLDDSKIRIYFDLIRLRIIGHRRIALGATKKKQVPRVHVRYDFFVITGFCCCCYCCGCRYFYCFCVFKTINKRDFRHSKYTGRRDGPKTSEPTHGRSWLIMGVHSRSKRSKYTHEVNTLIIDQLAIHLFLL